MPKFDERICSRRMRFLLNKYKHLGLIIIPIEKKYNYIIKFKFQNNEFTYDNLRFKHIREICEKEDKLCAKLADGKVLKESLPTYY